MFKVEFGTTLDFILMPFYLAVIYFIANSIKSKNIRDSSDFNYFVKGLMVKCFGAVVFCLVYSKYYPGGDTTSYFDGAYKVMQMSFYDFSTFIRTLSDDKDPNILRTYFTYNLCCPEFFRDENSFSVIRFTTPLALIGSFSYYNTTIVLAALSFSGPWKLFRLFAAYYPEAKKQIAVAVLYVPSVLFWGSGILKDTYTFSAACWFTWCVHEIFIKKERVLYNVIILIISSWVIISIKPYIFVSLLPGTLIWISFKRISSIKNTALKAIFAPMILILGFLAMTTVMSSLSDKLGSFSDIDKAAKRAQQTSEDLKREVYGKNSFDLGDFDGTPTSLIKVFPSAVFAGLFRPLVWESNNIVMFFSALENAFLLFVFLKTMWMTKLFKFFSYVTSDPLLVFCFLFSIFFAGSVGIATSNFGALVRYKIPCIPFFLATLYIIQYKLRKSEQSDLTDYNTYDENQQKELAST